MDGKLSLNTPHKGERELCKFFFNILGYQENMSFLQGTAMFVIDLQK